MLLGVFIAIFAFVAIVSVAAAYNHLIELKHNVPRAWANVDVLLSQRHEELPKLVALCERYMRHEKELLERVMKARAAIVVPQMHADARALGPLETRLRAELRTLFALAENYPELKANEHFLHLQRRISELETAIADRREFFNATVTINNVKIRQFPWVLLASFLGLQSFDLLRLDDAERANTLEAGRRLRA